MVEKPSTYVPVRTSDRQAAQEGREATVLIRRLVMPAEGRFRKLDAPQLPSDALDDEAATQYTRMNPLSGGRTDA